MAIRQLWASSVSAGCRITRVGIRYSNIDALHDSRTDAPYMRVRGRPRWSQCSTGTSRLAIATKLATRASDASRS